MADFVFGKAIDFTFTPLVNGEPTDAYALVSSRLYSTPPSNGEKEMSVSGGCLQEVTSWSGLGDSQYLISFNGVSDSNPHALTAYDTFYIVTNFQWEAAGPTVFAEEVVYMYKVDGWSDRIGVTVAELKVLENKFANEFESDAQIEAHIEAAKELLFEKLKARGYDKRRLFNLGKSLNKIVLYMSLASACNDLSSENSDRWNQKADKYAAIANELLDTAKIHYDLKDDDKPSANAAIEYGVVHIIR